VGAPASPRAVKHFSGLIYRKNVQVHPPGHEVHPIQFLEIFRTVFAGWLRFGGLEVYLDGLV